MHELPRLILIRLPTVFGMDLSITNEVLLLWIAAAITFVVLALACRRREMVASGAFRNFFEAAIEFVDRDVVRQGVGREGEGWGPFLLTLFFFILFSNLLGLVPDPYHFKAATSHLSVTSGLAAMVFIVTVLINVRRHGFFGFLRKFLPSGLPWALALLVVPIELVSWLARPISLAVRLFANMLAGHALIFVFIGLEMSVAWFLSWLPLAGAVFMSAFEVFVSFVQAFIFTMLAAVYIREALEAEAH